MKVIGVIPVRYKSTRFPGKALVKLKDRPIIQWVYENAKKASLDKVIIATDDERIFKTAQGFGAEVVMTSPKHRSGTERVAEVARGIKGEIFVNIQGDEPFLKPEMIDFLVNNFIPDRKADMGTLATYIKDKNDLESPDVVKVVFAKDGYALYFSRFPIPYLRDKNIKGVRGQWYKHLGIYAYRRNALFKFVKLPWGRLEKMESLEQLRALENGMRIKVIITKKDSLGIDNPQDLKKAEEWLRK
ncbi:MAG: 3-deoxy-manno-octulosonate cytidylyltransferase [Candidatus Omnitrophica bacterium]|nr:3-deoxy-manno-octulosonate cytidylyltransferase [Candidatus Omnitrophota bacterium]MCM8798379.1 3-deoxy-manno-octulosonate cytidylyltransferase [Candidatus Omnitrophota bacterium]